MQTISVDTMGPFPEAGNGDKYILVVIDNFTRFVELHPIPDLTAEVAARALLSYFGRYGVAKSIHTDNGTQFVNATITSLVDMLGIDHSTIHTYSHEENGMVERANKEVLRHLRGLVLHRESIGDWHYMLPMAQRIINSTVHSGTGYSPAELLFGASVNLDATLLKIPLRDQSQKTVNEWATAMLERQQKLHSLARSVQEDNQRAHLEQQKTTTDPFPPGTFVLVNYITDARGKQGPTKLHTNKAGPYRVMSRDRDMYTLFNPATGYFTQSHLRQLTRFLEREGEDPTQVTFDEEKVGVIEKVLEHRGHIERRSTLSFLVRWQGPRKDSWISWEDNRNNEIIHDYLKRHGMGRIIPLRHQEMPAPINEGEEVVPVQEAVESHSNIERPRKRLRGKG